MLHSFDTKANGSGACPTSQDEYQPSQFVRDPDAETRKRYQAFSWGNESFQGIVKRVLPKSVSECQPNDFDGSGIRRGPIKRAIKKVAKDGEDWQETVVGLLIDEWTFRSNIDGGVHVFNTF